LILVNVCGAESVLMSARLMHCSGLIHQCQPDKAEANSFMELRRSLHRYQVPEEAMAQRHRK
jgi:uncharacterized membrane protein YecN with MAPEG domain